MKPTRHTFESALKLQSPDMAPFYDWLHAERVEILELLTTAPEESLQRMQGHAQCLAKILNLIDGSRDMLEKTGA